MISRFDIALALSAMLISQHAEIATSKEVVGFGVHLSAWVGVDCLNAV